MKSKKISNILSGSEKFSHLKSINGLEINGSIFLYKDNAFSVERACVIIHDRSKTIGTELFVDSILGYQIGHYDGRHPERIDVTLDFIRFLIEEEINHSDLIEGDFHQSELGISYMAKTSRGDDMIPIKIYKSIDHRYDDCIEKNGGNLRRLRRIKSSIGMLKKLGISI